MNVNALSSVIDILQKAFLRIRPLSGGVLISLLMIVALAIFVVFWVISITYVFFFVGNSVFNVTCGVGLGLFLIFLSQVRDFFTGLRLVIDIVAFVVTFWTHFSFLLSLWICHLLETGQGSFRLEISSLYNTSLNSKRNSLTVFFLCSYVENELYY